MGNELTGKKASFTYTGLVQYIGGLYYDGAGNLLNIADSSSMNVALVNFINDASLNHSTFVWNGGLLDVNISAVTADVYQYIDGSLAARDASLGNLSIDSLKQNSSIGNIYVRLNAVDASLKLSALTDVTLTTPQPDQHLMYNGVEWINAPAGTISAGVGVTYYLSASENNVPGYETAWKTPYDFNEKKEWVVVNSSTNLLIDSYISEPSTGLGVLLIDGGIWEFNTFASVSHPDPSEYFEIQTHVYKRSYAGVESSLFSLTTGNITTFAPTLYKATSVQSEIIVDASDRLVFKYEARTNSINDVSVNFYHGGHTNYSYIRTPLALKHNDLAGLQGGSYTERYHMTLAELAHLTAAPVFGSISPNTALISSASSNVTSSVVTSTELAYLTGVTSNIQLQLSKALKLAKAGL